MYSPDAITLNDYRIQENQLFLYHKAAFIRPIRQKNLNITKSRGNINLEVMWQLVTFFLSLGNKLY